MFTKTFTDPQGVTHTDAIFQIISADINNNSNNTFNYDLASKTSNEISNSSNNLSYRIYYWVDQASLDSGLLPYILANSDPLGEMFYVDNLDSSYDLLSLEEKAEKHCQDNILI